MIIPAVLTAILLGAPPADTLWLEGGARGPATHPNGGLAVEMRGDLWLLDLDGRAAPIRLTDTPAWERDPAWSADGRTLVYSAETDGQRDLWSLTVGSSGAEGPPRRLTSGSGPVSEPAILADGRIVFVRGTGRAADLWLLGPGGEEERLTTTDGWDGSPAASPDGTRVAYVSRRSGGARLRIHDLESGADRAVRSDGDSEHPAWSPDGARIVFASRGSRGGIWVTDADGSYANQVGSMPGEPTWSAAGILVAVLPRSGPGYNGDPDRLGEREGRHLFPERTALRLLSDLTSPARGEAVAVRVPVDAAAYGLRVLGRLGDRTARLYYPDGSPEREVWTALGKKAEDELGDVRSEAELEAVAHHLIRERPHLRREARGRVVVSSAHPLATEAGLAALRLGGNVVDAAVAVSFALGVVEPDASGIGGYGQMLVYLSGMDSPVAIDFLTRVPEAASLSNGSLTGTDGRLPRDGPVLANVPGVVAGMDLAYRRYGSGAVSWSDLVAPAIRIAEEGFVLDRAVPTTLERERERYLKYAASRELFFPGGEALRPGDTLRNPDLAWTLGQIAEGGAEAFYRGAVAERMVSDLRSQGNAMSLDDVAHYFAVERRPLRGSYRGHTVYGSAPPTSGGASLLGKLHLLELVGPGDGYTDDAAKLHAMIEAWKIAPSTRGRVADPGLWPVDVTPFQSKDTARVRWKCFRPDQVVQTPIAGPCEPAATPGGAGEDPPAVGGVTSRAAADAEAYCDLEPWRVEGLCRAAGTTAFVVADAEGNMVAVTQTLGTWGGNFYVTPGLGFPYNDKLRSYGTDPSGYNARIPFARNVTSISPTLVFRGEGPDRAPLLALAAAGNAWITSAVYQVLTGVIDEGLGPQSALELPRFLVGGGGPPGAGGANRPTTIQFEDGLHPEAVRRLRELGHLMQAISLKGELRMGYGAAALIGDGSVRAGADPRRSGAAGALPSR